MDVLKEQQAGSCGYLSAAVLTICMISVQSENAMPLSTTPQHSYEAWEFCGGMGQAQLEEHWPCLWDSLLYTVDSINPQYAWREHRRKEANYHVFKQDIRYKLALCIWFAPCWQWRLHFLFLCRRYLHATGRDNDSFQIIWLIITCCSLLSQALVGLLFFKFYFKGRFTCPKNKVK